VCVRQGSARNSVNPNLKLETVLKCVATLAIFQAACLIHELGHLIVAFCEGGYNFRFSTSLTSTGFSSHFIGIFVLWDGLSYPSASVYWAGPLFGFALCFLLAVICSRDWIRWGLEARCIIEGIYLSVITFLIPGSDGHTLINYFNVAAGAVVMAGGAMIGLTLLQLILIHRFYWTHIRITTCIRNQLSKSLH
jgi:hypothetical protein